LDGPTAADAIREALEVLRLPSPVILNSTKGSPMSWTVQCPSQTADTLEGTARANYETFRGKYNDHEGAMVGMDEQFEAALAAATVILASGAVGTSAAVVTMSGHANPGHVKRDGWSNDSIVVSIAQH